VNLYQHFDIDTAAALERAIEQHPLLAEALHARVIHNRDITDSFVFTHQRGTWRSREDQIASAEEYRDRQRTQPQHEQPNLPEPKTRITPKRNPNPIHKPKPREPRNQPVTCQHCKKVFTPKRAGRKFCSRDCSINLGRQNLRLGQVRKHNRDPRTCLECHQTFTPPKPTSKYCSVTCHTTAVRKHLKPKPPKIPRAPKPIAAPKPPREPSLPKQTPINIHEHTHDGIHYVTTHYLKQHLAAHHPELLERSHYRRGTIWSLYGARYPIMRRLDIGHERMQDPIPLFSRTDCERLIHAQYQGRGAIGQLPKYTEPTTIRIPRVTIDGIEWMRGNEAISIIGGITIDEVIRTFRTDYEPNNIARKVAHALTDNKRFRYLPIMQLGSVKTFFYRTIDILPLAGTMKDILQ
jgi:hypothetical protein